MSWWLSSGRLKKLWEERIQGNRCGLMADQVREQGRVMHNACVGPARFVIWAEVPHVLEDGALGEVQVLYP